MHPVRPESVAGDWSFIEMPVIPGSCAAMIQCKWEKKDFDWSFAIESFKLISLNGRRLFLSEVCVLDSPQIILSYRESDPGREGWITVINRSAKGFFISIEGNQGYENPSGSVEAMSSGR